MRAGKRKLLAHVAWSSLFVSGCFGSVLPLCAQQDPQPLRTAAVETNKTTTNEAALPDSPGTIVAQAQSPAPAEQSPSTSSESSSKQPPQKPVGTAAAEAPPTTGVAASEPAGVAIAPAKQRRVRTIIIRTGAIIGAGVAIGAVAALSAGTSSKPPGAH